MVPSSHHVCFTSRMNELGSPRETSPIPSAPFCWSVAASANRKAATSARMSATTRQLIRGFGGRSSDGLHRRRRQLHRYAQPACRTRGEGEGSVVRVGDAPHDRETEADTGVICAYAFRAAPKRLGKRRDQLRGELLASVLDG